MTRQGYYEALLLEHVVEAWFPRCIDGDFGGFLCDFDRRWSAVGQQEKFLEFQARQTTTAAELMLAFPARPELREATLAGFAMLRDVLWDHDYGGWHMRATRQGRLLDPTRKHAHGMAYAIEACMAVFAATGDADALKLGNAGFDWLDANARDPVHGGYFGPLERDGRKAIAGDGVDHIGTRIGLKDMNVNKDLLGAFAYASRTPGAAPGFRPRFAELLRIILACWSGQSLPYFFFHPDWTPASGIWKPSDVVQGAATMLEFRYLSDTPDGLEDDARRLILHAFAGGRRTDGALLMSVGKDQNRRQARLAPWWAQFELLKGAEYLAALRPDDAATAEALSAARATVARFIDPRHGGVFPESRRHPLLSRFSSSRRTNKGDKWKDASHDGRALVRLAGHAPPAVAADVPAFRPAARSA